jgi:hypothetical protein
MAEQHALASVLGDSRDVADDMTLSTNDGRVLFAVGAPWQ